MIRLEERINNADMAGRSEMETVTELEIPVIKKGDIVETGLGHRYRVVKITKTKRFEPLIVCSPLTQQLWHKPFMFPPEALTKVDIA